MAFQSSVFRDGQWVTETVNLQDALRASAAPKPTSAPRPEPPVCGLLSRTVVESPVVHWTLPVRLRSHLHNDIAFIGDHFVQISELRPDGQIHEIIRKTDFGARIRNAIVFGASFQDSGANDTTNLIKIEDPDILMQDPTSFPGNHRSRPLPPQLLILMLETGDALFLLVKEHPDGTLGFVTSKHKCPQNLKFLGFHLSIDPTFRYMAAGSAEGALIVYELETLDVLNRQYLQQSTFSPIKSLRIRSFRGILHKMEFLYPRPEDDYHIILILIVVRNDRRLSNPTSRMVTYEWEVGDDLKSVFAEIKSGTRLPEDHKMPLLLIPLRFKTAFFAVSQHSIGIVQHVLSGSPRFASIPTDALGSTKMHHGAIEPLWTAWARPFRRKKYLEKTDIIYLAREDGVIIHIEIDSNDLVPSVTTVGSLNINVTTAFTTAFDVFSDILIFGGDSGPGGVWKLPARSDLEQVAAIPNWSPVNDLTTTDMNASWSPKPVVAQGSTKPGSLESTLRKSDRIFCTSGRGLKSSVTELRWGVQARIGLDIDFDQPVRQSWMFPVEVEGQNGFYAILALPDVTEVLHFSGDLSQVNALPSESISFDLSSRTIHAAQSDTGTILQITERNIAIISPSQSSQHRLDQLCNIDGLLAENAACEQDIIVIASHDSRQQRLHVIRIEQMGVSQVHVWVVEGLITCTSLFTVDGMVFVATGSMRNDAPFIAIHTLDGQEKFHLSMKAYNETVSSELHAQMEAFTSLYTSGNAEHGVKLVYGTRSGHLVTCKVPKEGLEHTSFAIERLGMAPCNVFPSPNPFDGKMATFACCDNNLLLLTDFSQQSTVFKTKNLIIPTDANDASMPSPPIHSVYGLNRSLSGYPGHISLLLLAGSRILLADIWPHVGPVPRTIPLDGTPMRILFSKTWSCLIVAHLKNHGPTLSFIDPDSGTVISVACDKERNPVESISGLGHQGDWVYGLCEWRYVKDGRTFPFLIVTTKSGSLMIVSVEVTESQTSDGPARCLKYWTRYKKKGLGDPVYAVVGDAENLVYCVGETLHWEVLDLGEKKLVPRKQYRLDSAATSLRVSGGKVQAVTVSHSLQVIDLHAESVDADISLIHSDPMTRYTSHQIEAGHSTEKAGEWPINILTTTNSRVAGIWIPWGQRNKEFSILFEGKLPASVRRLRRGHVRPIWISANRGQQYNTLLSTVDDAEIIGVGLDGSLYHFTLLGLELWRFLRLLQKLAQYSADICPFTYRSISDMNNWELEPQPHGESMHIDGDLLRRCLDHQALESLVNIGDGDGFDLFCEYLDAIEAGSYTTGFEDDADNGRKRYFELGYSILDYLLAPVF